MHQRDVARQAWERARLYRSRDADVRAFLKHFEETEADCWPELLTLVRTRYPAIKEQLAVPLWTSGDQLLRMNLLRAIDATQADEQAILQRLLGRIDPRRGEFELRAAVLHLDSQPLLDAIARRRLISDELRAMIDLRRNQLPP
jgi:hypothetical protein